jgi:hypothetical protein
MTQSGQIFKAGENTPALLPPAGAAPIAGLHAKAAVELTERHMRSGRGAVYGCFGPKYGRICIMSIYIYIDDIVQPV